MTTARDESIWMYFRRLPSWAQRLTWLLLCLGVFFTALGTIGDVKGWFWVDYGFAVNIATSFVAALFGIPVALVAVGWFTSSEARKQSRGDAHRLSINSWEDFEAAIVSYTAPAAIETLREDAYAIAESFRAIEHLIQTIPTEMRTAPNNYHPMTVATIDEFQASGIRDEIRRSLAAVRWHTQILQGAIDDEVHNHREWLSIIDKWAFLSSEVRVSRQQNDLCWMDPESNKTFIAIFYDPEHPYSQVLQMISFHLRWWVSHFDKVTTTGSVNDLVIALRAGGSGYYFSPDAFITASTTAANLLSTLRTTTLHVTTTGWPEP